MRRGERSTVSNADPDLKRVKSYDRIQANLCSCRQKAASWLNEQKNQPHQLEPSSTPMRKGNPRTGRGNRAAACLVQQQWSEARGVVAQRQAPAGNRFIGVLQCPAWASEGSRGGRSRGDPERQKE